MRNRGSTGAPTPPTRGRGSTPTEKTGTREADAQDIIESPPCRGRRDRRGRASPRSTTRPAGQSAQGGCDRRGPGAGRRRGTRLGAAAQAPDRGGGVGRRRGSGAGTPPTGTSGYRLGRHDRRADTQAALASLVEPRRARGSPTSSCTSATFHDERPPPAAVADGVNAVHGPGRDGAGGGPWPGNHDGKGLLSSLDALASEGAPQSDTHRGGAGGDRGQRLGRDERRRPR